MVRSLLNKQMLPSHLYVPKTMVVLVIQEYVKKMWSLNSWSL